MLLSLLRSRAACGFFRRGFVLFVAVFGVVEEFVHEAVFVLFWGMVLVVSGQGTCR